MSPDKQVNIANTCLLVAISDEHRYEQGEDDHDEGGRYVRSSRHPGVHKSKMFTGHNISNKAPIVLRFRQSSNRANEHIIVAEKVFQHKPRERIAKASIVART